MRYFRAILRHNYTLVSEKLNFKLLGIAARNTEQPSADKPGRSPSYLVDDNEEIFALFSLGFDVEAVG